MILRQSKNSRLKIIFRYFDASSTDYYLFEKLWQNSTRDAVSTGRRSSYDVGGVVGSKSILAPPNAHGAHDNRSALLTSQL